MICFRRIFSDCVLHICICYVVYVLDISTEDRCVCSYKEPELCAGTTNERLFIPIAHSSCAGGSVLVPKDPRSRHSSPLTYDNLPCVLVPRVHRCQFDAPENPESVHDHSVSSS